MSYQDASRERFRLDAFRALQIAQRQHDAKTAHVMADAALCDLLIKLGFGDVVRGWNRVPKWRRRPARLAVDESAPVAATEPPWAKYLRPCQPEHTGAVDKLSAPYIG